VKTTVHGIVNIQYTVWTLKRYLFWSERVRYFFSIRISIIIASVRKHKLVPKYPFHYRGSQFLCIPMSILFSNTYVHFSSRRVYLLMFFVYFLCIGHSFAHVALCRRHFICGLLNSFYYWLYQHLVQTPSSSIICSFLFNFHTGWKKAQDKEILKGGDQSEGRH
jgi:hypothetical protein